MTGFRRLNYGKYISSMKKDLRAGFAQVDKAYAYAKVDTRLNVRESGSTSARIVGTLPAKALCFVIADADQEWVYIESGDVRGFVRTDYLQQGKEDAGICNRHRRGSDETGGSGD